MSTTTTVIFERIYSRLEEKKKKKEKKNYLFSIERFSDARCMPSLTDEQIWGNLNREIRGILLIIGIILEESSFIYIYHNSLFTWRETDV